MPVVKPKMVFENPVLGRLVLTDRIHKRQTEGHFYADNCDLGVAKRVTEGFKALSWTIRDEASRAMRSLSLRANQYLVVCRYDELDPGYLEPESNEYGEVSP